MSGLKVIFGLFLFVSNCNSQICNSSECYDVNVSCYLRDQAHHCVDIEEIIRTDLDRQVLLHKINSRRNKVASGDIKSLPAAANMFKLDWNEELEASAKKRANQCVRSKLPDIKDACRQLGNTNFGQNVATVFGESPGLKPDALVDVWYMELLNINSSVILQYQESSKIGYSHYDYFTQLIWANTREVGCSSVKFKEQLESGDKNHRVVYRLVCNFAPQGNRLNENVYTYGTPCSQCTTGTSCDSVYSAMCSGELLKNNTQLVINETVETTTLENERIEKSELNNSRTSQKPIATDDIAQDTGVEEEFTPYDFFGHFHDFTKQTITLSTKQADCKDLLAVDDFIELLRKRINNDRAFKELLLATKLPTNFNYTEYTFTDPSVAALMDRIYSKKEPTTTTKYTENDVLNSTLLVDLVEAVIFRSGDKATTNYDDDKNIQALSEISPVKIQAELSEVRPNHDFMGHYFFPEDDDEITTKTVEEYYDTSTIPASDVLIEIEDIKKLTTVNDFLDDILEYDTSTETTLTDKSLMPDVTIYNGRNIMKKFLDEIKERDKTLPI